MCSSWPVWLYAAQLEVAQRDPSRHDELLVGDLLVGREAHHEVAPVVGEAAHGLLHHRGTDVVEDDVDATALGRVEDELREVGLRVVDRDLRAELAAERHLLGGAGGREYARALVDGELDGGRAGAAGAGVDEHALTGAQVGAVEETEPGEVEGEVERSRIGQRNLRGHVERRHDGADGVLGEAAVGAARHRDHPSPLPRLGTGAAGVDHAHDLHAGAVRQLGLDHHVAAGDALEVVQVERDRLHAHPHLARLRLGNRHAVELQHLGRARAVLVRPPRAHRPLLRLSAGHSTHPRRTAAHLAPAAIAPASGAPS